MIQSEILRPENRDVAWNFLSNPFGIFSKDERQGDKDGDKEELKDSIKVNILSESKPKAKEHNKIEDEIEFTTTFLNQIFSKLGFTDHMKIDGIPYIIRVFMQTLKSCLEKHSETSEKLVKETDINDSITRLLLEKWLVPNFFFDIDELLLIENWQLNYIYQVLYKISIVFMCCFNGEYKFESSTRNQAYIKLFSEYISEKYKQSKKFFEILMKPKKLNTQENLFNCYCVSDGIISKMSQTCCENLELIENQKLKAAIETIDYFERNRTQSLMLVNHSELTPSSDLDEINPYLRMLIINDVKQREVSNDIISDRYSLKLKQLRRKLQLAKIKDDRKHTFNYNEESLNPNNVDNHMLEKYCKGVKDAQFEKHLLSLIHEVPNEYWGKSFNKNFDYNSFVKSLKTYDLIKNSRMNKNSSNLEILLEILHKIPEGVPSTKDILKELEEEINRSLLRLDDEIIKVIDVSINLTQKIEYLKADIHLADLVKLAHQREKVIYNSDLQVCTSLDEDQVLFSLVSSKECKECCRKRSFRKGSDPNRIVTSKQRDAKFKEARSFEDIFIQHRKFSSFTEFMNFFEEQIENNTSKLNEENISKISLIFNKYMSIVQEYIMNDPELCKNANLHLSSISNYVTRRYLKYNVFQKVYKTRDNDFKILSSKIKSISKFPPIIEHYVWKKAISELLDIDEIHLETKVNSGRNNETKDKDNLLRIYSLSINIIKTHPQIDFIHLLSLSNKFKALHKCFSTISKAFLLLVEDTNEVTADDLLQFAAFVFVLSDVKTLASSIQYIKQMNWNPNPEEMGEYHYVLTTTLSSLEYLKSRFTE